MDIHFPSPAILLFTTGSNKGFYSQRSWRQGEFPENDGARCAALEVLRPDAKGIQGGRRRKWMRSRAATETMWYIYVHVKIDDSSIVTGFICVFLDWSRRYSHFLERNTHHLCSCCNMATVAFLCSIQLVRQATASGSNAFWR